MCDTCLQLLEPSYENTDTDEKQINHEFAEIKAMLRSKDEIILRAEYALTLLEAIIPEKVHLAREIAKTISLLDVSEILAMQEAMAAGLEKFKAEL